jgi:hypothetical protein
MQLNCKHSDKAKRALLDEIELYIHGAVAAANNCATDLATELYQKATSVLDKLLKHG